MKNLQNIRCAFAGSDQNDFSFGLDEEDFRCKELKIKLSEQVHILYENGFRSFMTDCTRGVSMWSAEIVAELIALHSDIELVCVIPYENQATKWSKGYQNRYLSLLQKCSQTILLNTDYTTNCFLESYRYLVDSCHVLLAVCDYQNSGFGNVGFMESYAKNTGRRVIYIHPTTLVVTQRSLNNHDI